MKHIPEKSDMEGDYTFEIDYDYRTMTDVLSWDERNDVVAQMRAMVKKIGPVGRYHCFENTLGKRFFIKDHHPVYDKGGAKVPILGIVFPEKDMRFWDDNSEEYLKKLDEERIAEYRSKEEISRKEAGEL